MGSEPGTFLFNFIYFASLYHWDTTDPFPLGLKTERQGDFLRMYARSSFIP